MYPVTGTFQKCPNTDADALSFLKKYLDMDVDTFEMHPDMDTDTLKYPWILKWILFLEDFIDLT